MGPRRFEVDLVKALGIIAVVLIHSMRPAFSAESSSPELWLGLVMRFAVPGFLVASGILHATAERVPTVVTSARLRRLLLPYLLASLAAQLFWVAFEGRTLAASEVLRDLLFASSFGPFYYVLQAVLFVLAAPVLATLRPHMLVAVTVGAIVAQWLSWVPQEHPTFWGIRNPLLWFGFPLAAWWIRRHEASVLPWLARHRASVCLLSGVAAGAASTIHFLTSDTRLSGSMAWLYVASALSLLLALAVRRENPPRAVRFLSDSSYSIYLFHLFFVYPVQRLVPSASGVFDPVAIGAAWLAGLMGPLLIAAAGRALLGARSRTILGS